MSSPTDAELIAACQHGSPERFAELYDRYARSVYDFIYFKTCHRETAEDLTSQTFFKAFEHLRDFDADRGKFSAWLFRIARNNVIDHYRTSHPSVELTDAFDQAGSEDLVARVDARVRLAKVRELLRSLPPDTREILMLRVWQDLSYAEIAAITGKTEAAVKMTFFRSVKKLRTEDLLLALFVLLFSSRL